jgi:hypothetical protein
MAEFILIGPAAHGDVSRLGCALVIHDGRRPDFLAAQARMDKVGRNYITADNVRAPIVQLDRTVVS